LRRGATAYARDVLSAALSDPRFAGKRATRVCDVADHVIAGLALQQSHLERRPVPLWRRVLSDDDERTLRCLDLLADLTRTTAVAVGVLHVLRP
jgi:hypothetical protein